MKTLWLPIVILAALSSAANGERPRRDAAPNKLQTFVKHQELERSSLLHGLKWREIGPVTQGGRVLDVEQVPGKPYSFYVAYATGGVWRTDNNGATFEPLSDALPTMVTGDIAVDPNNPSALWIGSGEPNSSRSSYGGAGVFYSADGGRNFEHRGLASSDRIARVLVDPRRSDRVFAAVLGKLYTDGGERGVYLTEDGGKTWARVLGSKQAMTGAIDLAFDPVNPDHMYAALWERSRRPWEFVEGGRGSGLYKSTDGGRTWKRVEGGFPSGPDIGRIGIAVAPSAPNVVYASVDHQESLPESAFDLGHSPLDPKRLARMDKAEFLRQDPDAIEALIRASDLPPDLDAAKLRELIETDALSLDALRDKLKDGNAALFDAEIRGLELWRSNDGGASWARTHEAPLRDVTFTYGYYFGTVAVAPDNPERVYIVGVPALRSDDGGKSFSGVHGSEVHVDHHAWWIDPDHPERMILGNDGGIDLSHDGGQTWVKLDAQPVGQIYAVELDMAEPFNVYVGMQDNGTMVGPVTARTGYATSDPFRFINGGDGMYTVVDPRDAKRHITGYQFGFYRHSDGHEVRPRPALPEAALRFNWQTPLLLSPHQPEVLYMGANRLYRSFDQGRSFAPISPDLTRSDERGNVPFATITTIDESPLQFGRLIVGTDDGQVQVSADGGLSWTRVSRKLPALWVSRVVASRIDADRLYLTLNGYREDDPTPHLYVSDDFGRTWRSLSPGLPAEALNVVREDPLNPDLLYVGSDRGVYVSWDRGASWQALASGLPNVPVHDLKVHPRDRQAVIGTHGRSALVIDVLPLQELTAEVRAQPLRVFHIDPIETTRSWRQPSAVWYPERNLPQAPIHYWAKRGGSVTLRIRDSDDAVLYQTTAEAQPGINRLDWNLEVDRDLALAAEQARVAKLEAEERELRANMPYAEAARLGLRWRIVPGTYRLEVSQGDATSHIKFKVEPPKPWTPRQPKKPKLRGRDD